jgi:hypothetical protein
MTLGVSDDDVNALGLTLMGLLQHRIRLTHTGGIAQEDLQVPA